MASEGIKNEDLFLHLREKNLTIKNDVANEDALHEYVVGKWNLEDISAVGEQVLKKKIRNFLGKLIQKWTSKSVNQSNDIFLKKESTWLNRIFEMPEFTAASNVPKESDDDGASGPITLGKRGRPKKDFTELGDRGKRSRISETLATHGTPEVLQTAQSKFYRKGLRTESELITIMAQDHEKAKVVKHLFTDPPAPKLPTPFKTHQALALLMENSMTKQHYINIRVACKDNGADIWPVYKEIINGKKECYPHGIEASEVHVKVSLQALLDHTTSRIFETLTDVLKVDISKGEYVMIYKWGMDGTSSQARYKQKFEETDRETVEETSLIVISLVPLNLRKKMIDDEDVVIWNNLRYSSPLFCRPLSLEFAKETVEKTKQCVGNIADQISDLQNTTLNVYGSEVLVDHTLIFSMINGKTCSAITDISNQRCQICGCPPTQMNDKSKADHVGNPESVGFGISVLHTWIRVFENLIHIAYRLPFRKWRVQDTEDKAIFEDRKARIQRGFKAHSILVDFVLQGKGTTNDGNTARTFFRKATISASITGLDETLIRRFHNLLCAISCGQPLDIGRYHVYALETFDLYNSLYDWYYLSPHTHKLLLHSSFIVQHLLLPVGQLSEEASEAANKYIRKFRLGHTRKTSRKETNEDLIKRLFVNSDPLISTVRKIQSSKKEKIPIDAANLLLERQTEDEIQKNKENEENFQNEDIEYEEDFYDYESQDEDEDEDKTSHDVEDPNKPDESQKSDEAEDLATNEDQKSDE